MDKRLVVFNHNRKNKTICICFADFKDNKIISQEEAIFEEKEIYKILKTWLVKYKHK